MSRAILIVLDSVGCGGAEDAAAYGDAGADTLGHIAEACALGRGNRDGLRQGPLGLPRLDALGLGHAIRASTGRTPPGFAMAPAARTMGLRNRDVARQGHALGPLGDRRHSGRFRLGLFPANNSRLPGDADRLAGRRGQASGHSRQKARLGHRDHRGIRRGACEDREADLLHLGRFRLSDRRARGGLRPRTALRSLPHRAPSLRPAEHRPRDRPSLRRQDGARTSSAPPTARISPCRRPTATCCSGRRRQAAQSSRSARSATFSPIATRERSARARATTAMSISCSTR